MANDYGVNPFESPRTTNEFAGLRDSVMGMLRRTRPWVFLMAILSSISLGMMGIGVVSMLVANAGKAGQDRVLAMAGAYSFLILIYLYPVVCLWRYASRIKLLMQTEDLRHMVPALDAQRGFWTATGIISGIFTGMYTILITLWYLV
jgi:hypothetical protein